ncbi:hypothetical protein CEXT_434781 [Caerostris extrusa]|uniref:Uncharacterized protein n=1 Tax=Caerostris extrusa TaxID=172846 RepID=A0AAV4XTW7_CAEEX|nr:hypothetical protein CEXT_434781 [Caerostris extrusa]
MNLYHRVYSMTCGLSVMPLPVVFEKGRHLLRCPCSYPCFLDGTWDLALSPRCRTLGLGKGTYRRPCSSHSVFPEDRHQPRCPSSCHWRRRPYCSPTDSLETDSSPTDSLETDLSPTDSSETEFSPTESSPETESSPTVLLPDTESLDPSLLATVFLEPLTDSELED